MLFRSGTHDPFDHIATFKITMHLQGVLDEIMCRAFPTTLKGPARVWFSKIPPNSISSFEELSKLFVNNFIRGQRHKRSSSSLLTIEQGENESLRSFITRFNQEALTVDEVDDKLLLAAFHNGVNSDLFIHKLYKKASVHGRTRPFSSELHECRRHDHSQEEKES